MVARTRYLSPLVGLAALLTLATRPSNAQDLTADYEFQRTLTSSAGTAQPLINLGTNSFITELVDGNERTVLFFPQGSGLALPQAIEAISNTYSVVVLFRFTDVNGWRRIIDWKNATSDHGLYNYYSNLNFYPYVVGSSDPIQADAYVQVVLTRDVDKTVVGYVDGVQQFSFMDSSDDGILDASQILRFFQDDTSVPNEESAGAVARIRLYDGALTAAQVAALDRLRSCGPRDLVVTHLSPRRGGNIGRVTITAQGCGFVGGAAVRLMREGQLDIMGELVSVNAGGFTIATTFDLTGARPGIWSVVVTNPDNESAALDGAFEVVDGVGGLLDIQILAPARVRVGRETQYQVIARNVGLTDLESVFILTRAREEGRLLAQDGRVFDRIPPSRAVTLTQRVIPASAQCIEIGGEGGEGVNCERLQNAIDSARTELAEVLNDLTRLGTEFAIQGCTLPPPDPNVCNALAFTISQLQFREAVLEEGLNTLEDLQAVHCMITALSNGVESHPSQAADGRAAVAVNEILCPVTSWDPNDKVGLTGSGEASYVRGAVALPYTVFFENVMTATAPAQQVVITDQLDLDLDLSSLALGAIRFGATTVPVPEETQSFTTTLDLRPANNLLIEIGAALDPSTRRITWSFISLDPATGQPPTDPFAGFLPPNVKPPEGEGSVSFTVMPKQGLPTGAQIRNRATIVFDTNPPIDTRETLNTIDSAEPSSAVATLTSTGLATFPLQWSGTDVGSGIKDYTIFVSEDSGPFTVLLLNTSDTGVTFAGQVGKLYAFYSVARDGAGNVEGVPTTPDTMVASGLLGDCLGNDDAIDIFDVLHKIDIILGRVTPGPTEILCDDDCDGDIDIFDVLREIDAILGRVPQPLTCPIPQEALSPRALGPAPRVVLGVLGRALRLANRASAVRAVELTLMPEGGPVEVLDVRATRRTRSFLVAAHQADPRAPVKVVVVSLAGAVIRPGDGIIARLKLAGGSPQGRLRLTDVRVAE